MTYRPLIALAAGFTFIGTVSLQAAEQPHSSTQATTMPHMNELVLNQSDLLYLSALKQRDEVTGIRYLSGGIGDAEQEYIKSHKSEYNTHLLFVDKKTGGYLAEVGVQIMDEQGNIVLNDMSDGPFFYINLPAGTYKVLTNYMGEIKQEEISLRSANQTRNLKFIWDNVPNEV